MRCHRKFLGTLLVGMVALSTANADTLPEKDIRTLLKKGGTTWSVSDVAFTGFNKIDTPGKVLFLWPETDELHRVRVDDRGKGSARLKLHWQLRSGPELPKYRLNNVTYQWGEPDGRAYGFQVATVDKSATSGKLTVSLSFSKKNLEKLKGNQDVILIVTNGKSALGNFLRLKLKFPN